MVLEKHLLSNHRPISPVSALHPEGLTKSTPCLHEAIEENLSNDLISSSILGRNLQNIKPASCLPEAQAKSPGQWAGPPAAHLGPAR